MKKICIGILVLGIVSVNKISFAAAGLKIGCVDIAAVFDQYSETKKNKEGLEKEIKVKQDVIEKMSEELRKLREDVQDQDVSLSPEEKKGKLDEIERKSQELQKYTEDAENDLRKREANLTEDILKKIYQTVQQIGKEKEFTIIIDKNNVLYGVDSLDITADVLKRLENPQKVIVPAISSQPTPSSVSPAANAPVYPSGTNQEPSPVRPKIKEDD